MKKLKNDKSIRSSIAIKLSHFGIFSNRKNLGELISPATGTTKSDQDCEEIDKQQTGPTKKPSFSSPKTVRFRDSKPFLNSNSGTEHFESNLPASRDADLSQNDADNLFTKNERHKFLRHKLNSNRLSMDVAQAFIRSRDHDQRKVSPEKRARSLTRSQRAMWNQRRNTIATEDAGSPKHNSMKLSSEGVILRQKKNYRGGSRLSIFQNSTETFMAMLRNSEKRKSFRAFLESEYSEENLDFWVQCEEYRQMKPKMRKKAAMKIFQTYFGDNARREINIDGSTLERTLSKLQDCQENTFDEAQKHIFDLMERDSFRRFIMSEKTW